MLKLITSSRETYSYFLALNISCKKYFLSAGTRHYCSWVKVPVPPLDDRPDSYFFCLPFMCMTTSKTVSLAGNFYSVCPYLIFFLSLCKFINFVKKNRKKNSMNT